MAVDPVTGQTVIPQGFEQRYAGFFDPAAVGQLQSDQSHNQMLGQLGQSLMQSGYVPNSGFGGALAQMTQAMIGAYMTKHAQDQMADIYSRRAQAESQAARAAHEQMLADKAYDTNESIRKTAGEKDAEEKIKLANAEQEAKNAAQAAGLKSQAELPSQMALEKQKGGYQLEAAQISANAANRRGYVVPDANGNSVVVSPQGQVIYQATTPGGGKLTPAQVELNKADEGALQQFNVRQGGAKQLDTNLRQWAAKYTGADPEAVAKMTPAQVSDLVRKQGHGLANALNFTDPNGLDATAADLAINAGTTKRGTVTEEILKTERANTVSRFNTPEKNASIIQNHFNDIHELNQQIQDTTNRINSRQPPGAGRIPAASNGPQNPGVGFSHADILAELQRRAAAGNVQQDMTPQ